MTLRLRDLRDDERTEVQRITRSHTPGAAFVRRAQIVVHAMNGLRAEEIARRMDLCGNTVRHWINRFNARGLDGLEEDVRTGRPPTYSAEQRSAGQCHSNSGAPKAATIICLDATDLVCPPPISAGRHPACRVALSPVHAELPGH